MKDGLDSIIEKIEADDEYNKEKGQVVVGPANPMQTAGTISVKSIKKNAILKLTIYTTEQRPISSRASLQTIPLRVSCPGGL
jgi:hypothetical protein